MGYYDIRIEEIEGSDFIAEQLEIGGDRMEDWNEDPDAGDIEDEDEEFDAGAEVFADAMDGDHESALASIGWGTDEDYGYYGGFDDF